jgi:PAS domain S-box-containing protein
MISKRSQDIVVDHKEQGELELLREENARLIKVNREAFDYIRNKVNSLLKVVGTKGLQPEELDDHSLVQFDPIGIVANTFQHFLENLQETNQKLHFAHDEIKTVLETIGAAVLVLDPEGHVVSYNQKVRDLMLDSDIDIRGKRCSEQICHKNFSAKKCIFKSVMHSRREQHSDDWSLGSRSFDVIGRPMFDEDGEITHVVMAYHDVSSRRDAQAALVRALNETKEANAKIHGILSSAADGIMVTDSDNNVVLINRRAEELIGFCLSDQSTPTRVSYIPHDGVTKLIQQVPGRGQETFTEDIVFELPEQSECICQARITAIKSSTNEFNGCIMLLHDVTEQRTIERMKDEFVSTAAHELRTPLATIIGYTDLMLMDNEFSPDQQTEFLQQIQKKAERLGEIVSDLLDISRIESGEAAHLEPKPNRIDKICEELVTGLRLQPSDHEFVLDFPAEPVAMAIVDRYAMTQILENLLSNAVKYSPDGGEIRISCQFKKDTLLLTISDQGLGMTSDQVARVYDKFYRVDATNTAVSGTGLGMTIVKHLVEAQNGKVSIMSSKRIGTTVVIELPLVLEDR